MLIFGCACQCCDLEKSALIFLCRSAHTLPITSLYCGMGANPIVVTASLDRSCRIWSLAQGLLIWC